VNIEAFIISMAGQPAREAQVQRIRESCPIRSTVVAATDGRALDDPARARVFRPALHRPSYPFAPRPGEIGCFLSHRSVWQLIVDRGLEAGLILEDDTEPEPMAFGRALALAIEATPLRGLVRLPLMERIGWRLRHAARPSLTVPVVLPLGTQAQVVSADAARRLLEASRCFDRPVDVFLQMPWVTGVEGCVVSPSGVFDASGRLGGSIIQGRPKGIRAALMREVQRPLYRWAVRVRCTRRRLLAFTAAGG
jgi:GR25 family glycosyltransferase involved in LPS biosynthesis